MADNPSNRGQRGFHRGRRGPDRRGGGARGNNDRGPDRGGERGGERNQDRGQDSRPQAGGPAPVRTENADVAQIMRDIRARITQRHGISLSDQQVEELAARRLEAVLDIRGLSPDLLEQLRRAAGGRSVEVPTGAQASPYEFEAETLYETPRGLLRAIRRVLNPILRLFFNPEPLVMALNQQARLNAAAAEREAARVAQQAEWNALHYALLQRLLSELAKLSLEAQHLTQQVESLSTKVDFNDRRVRGIEGGVHLAEVRSAPAPSAPRQQESGGGAPLVSENGGGDGPRRKRRRRRGRRPGGPDQLPGTSGAQTGGGEYVDGGEDDGPDEGSFGDAGESGDERSGGDGGFRESAAVDSTPSAAAAEPAGAPAQAAPSVPAPANVAAPSDPVEP